MSKTRNSLGIYITLLALACRVHGEMGGRVDTNAEGVRETHRTCMWLQVCRCKCDKCKYQHEAIMGIWKAESSKAPGFLVYQSP